LVSVPMPLSDLERQNARSIFPADISLKPYYMFYTLHVVEPLRYDSVLIKETNEMKMK